MPESDGWPSTRRRSRWVIGCLCGGVRSTTGVRQKAADLLHSASRTRRAKPAVRGGSVSSRLTGARQPARTTHQNPMSRDRCRSGCDRSCPAGRCAQSTESLAAKRPRRDSVSTHLAWERRELTSARTGRRGRRHIAQELIAAVPLDHGQVVRDQPARPFDCHLDTILREIEYRDAATAIAAMHL